MVDQPGHHGTGHRTAKGVAAVRAAMIPSGHARRDGIAYREGCKREAAGNAFAHGQNVRLHTCSVHGKEAAGAAEPGLHFIRNEQGTVFLAQLRHRLQIARGSHTHPALALNGFQNDGRDIVSKRLSQCCDVAKGHEMIAGHLRTEACAILGTTGQGQRGQRAPVEGASRCQHAGAAGNFARELDRRIIGFRAAVGEEHPMQTRRQQGLQLLQQPGADWRIGESGIGVLHQLAGLLDDGLHDHRMGMAQTGNAPAGRKVQPGPALFIPDTGAQSALEGHGLFHAH